MLPFAPSVLGHAGALALGNPAALALADGLAFGVNGAAGGDRFDGERGSGWSLSADASFGDFGVGVAIARTIEPAPPASAGQSAAGLSTLALGVGARLGGLLRLGVALRPLLDVDDGVLGVDLGIVADLLPWLSLGATLQDALASTRYLRAPTLPIVSGPQMVFGVAAGEPQGDWQLALDLTWPDGAALRRASAMMQLRVHDDVWIAVEMRRALDAAAGVGSEFAAADVRAAATTRFAAQIRWFDGPVELAPSLWMDRDEAGKDRFGLGLFASWRLPATSWIGGGVAPKREGRRGTSRNRAQAKASRSGGRAAQAQLSGRQLSEIAKAVLALHAALAAERGEDVCAWIASDGARLDVESVEPALSVHRGKPKAGICAELANRQGDWGTYLRELGPARVHDQMKRFLPLLFRLHGAVVGVLPDERASLLASLLQRDTPDLACRRYSARAFEGLGGVELIDVRVGCPGEAEVTSLWIAEDGGYRLTKLAIDHRPGLVSAPAGESPSPPSSPSSSPPSSP